MSDISEAKKLVRKQLKDGHVHPRVIRRDTNLPEPTSPEEYPDEYWDQLPDELWETADWDKVPEETRAAIPDRYLEHVPEEHRV